MILSGGIPDFNWYDEFVEVDRPGKLVLTLADRPGDAREMVTVSLTQVAGGTGMICHQGGGNLDAAEYERVTDGWQAFFDAMESLVAT